MRPAKAVTHTTMVLEALVAADDLVPATYLVWKTQLGRLPVARALHILQHYKAVGVVVQDGHGHYFATPETDTRCRIVEERTPESRPRRTKLMRSGK